MQESEKEVTFKGLFVPFTTLKAIVILCLFGFLLFFFGLFNGFVQDDNTQIVSNSAVHSIKNIPSFFLENRLTTGGIKLGGGYFKPFLDTSFALIYNLFGPSPFFFHLFLVVLFITNACLLFVFFKKILPLSISFLLSLIFLVHPINSEGALYISAMQEVLFFFFGMIGLLIFIKYNSQKAFILSNFFLLLSLLSKETGILFILIVLLYSFIFKRKYFLKMLGYSLLILGLYIVLRVHAVGLLSHGSMNAPIEKLGLLQRLINAPMIVLFYLKSFILPLYLSSSWQWVYTRIDFFNFILPALIDSVFLGGLVFLGLYIKRHEVKLLSLFVFFGLWLGIGLVFHMQILPLDQTVAGRWFYFPIVGVLGIIGICLGTFKIRLKSHFVLFLIIAVISLLTFRTFLRSLDFTNDFMLANADVKVAKGAYNLEYILSHEYYAQGKFNDAKIHAIKSVELFPYITNYTNLGAIYSSMGNYKLAKENYLKAITHGTDSLPYENLASLALTYGDAKENITFMKNISLKKYPKDGSIWFYLTIVAYRNGEKDIANMALYQAKKYSKNPNLDFVSYVITQNKPLDLEIKNGSVTFYTVK